MSAIGRNYVDNVDLTVWLLQLHEGESIYLYLFPRFPQIHFKGHTRTILHYVSEILTGNLTLSGADWFKTDSGPLISL